MSMKKIISFSLLIITFSFFEVIVTAIPTINCSSPTCYVGNCPCSISDCNTGNAWVYTTPCTFTPKLKKSFIGNSVTLTISEVGSYNVKIYCNDPYGEQSSCTNIVVSSGGTCSAQNCHGCVSEGQCSGVGCIWCSTNGPCENSYSNCPITTTTTSTTTTTGGVTTTTTTLPSCSSYGSACNIDCGKTLSGRYTEIKEYFKFTLASANDVSVKISPGSNVDYDLYMTCDGTEPSESNYCHESHNGIGLDDTCPNSGYQNLGKGTYYAMVKYYSGSGTYDISLTCTSGTTTTTTSGGVTTTTTGLECSSFTGSCNIDCGKSLRNKQTNDKQYFNFNLTSTSTVTVYMNMSSGVDYDLFVKWSNSQPTENDYDYKSTKDMGMSEEIVKTNLGQGTYSIMVDRMEGYGTYDLYLSCESVGGTTTTTTIQGCSPFSSACNLRCGRSLTGSTTTNNYYKFNISSTSDVTIKMNPSTDADYDLYVAWDGNEPTETESDTNCRSSKEKGLEETCSRDGLVAGTYYAMVNYYPSGSGDYNISLSCSGETTTTTTISGTTTIETTTEGNTTTTEETGETTTTEPECGQNGYCINVDVECNTGYKSCPNSNEDCNNEEMKCCCLSEITPKGGFGYELFVGLFLGFVLIILIYFYMKSKSNMTYEKLYKKWSRIYVD